MGVRCFNYHGSTLAMVEYLINKIIEKKEKKKDIYSMYNKNYYCIPHNISCNLNSEILKYSSIKKGIIMPIFVTYDTFSIGFRVIFDSESVILRDDINIFVKGNICISLYIYIYI